MNTVDVFVVIREINYDCEELAGIYQRKEDAFSIRDHLDAIQEDQLRERYKRVGWNGTFKAFMRYCGPVTHRVEEEDLYV